MTGTSRFTATPAYVASSMIVETSAQLGSAVASGNGEGVGVAKRISVSAGGAVGGEDSVEGATAHADAAATRTNQSRREFNPSPFLSS
jgi:hypothetical protein